MPHKFDPKHLQRLEYVERFNEEPFDDIKNVIDFSQAKKIVDLGCGPGFHTFALAHYLPADGKVFALDISKEMIDHLKLNMENGKIFHLITPEDKYKIEPILIKENHFPIPDQSIDIIFNVKLFHEIDSLPDFFKEAHRILKHKGTIFTIDWKKIPTEKGPPIEHRIDFDDAIRIFEKYGFKIQKSGEIYQSFYYILATINN